MAETWMESIQKAERSPPPNPITMDDIHQVMKEVVTARQSRFNEAFAAIDYANIGVLSKEDFRQVLNEVAFRMAPDQVSGAYTPKLWNDLPYHIWTDDELEKENHKARCLIAIE